MHGEQAFDELVDTEHLFVLEYQTSEQVFEQGDAMSVALELENETSFPRLQLLAEPSRPAPSRRIQARWVVLALAVLGLLVLLALPIRAIGGKPIAGSAPAVGQEYVVQSGDTLTSIAQRVDRGNVAGMVRRLEAESGAPTVVPGEHLLIP